MDLVDMLLVVERRKKQVVKNNQHWWLVKATGRMLRRENGVDPSLKIVFSSLHCVSKPEWNAFLKCKQVNVSPCVHNRAKVDGDQAGEALLLIWHNACIRTHGHTSTPNASQPCVCDLSAPSERSHLDSLNFKKIHNANSKFQK